MTVKFIINNPDELKREILNVISKYQEGLGKIDKKRLQTIPKLIDGYIKWKVKKIPFQGSEGSVMSLFLRNATIRQGKLIIKDGQSLGRTELQKVGGISIASFREVMKSIRAKIKKYKLPIMFEHPTKGFFHMIIKN